ncbi:hypothetical protein WJX72_002561 [[Myrmecia] bisecta]|uniref:Uncharacterized protein n=1 Tax=[Myrmecia] bisecta TaxID=41462 RepID=A0AAW1QPI8_9CHLO
MGKPFFRNKNGKKNPAIKSIQCAIKYSQLRGHSFVVRDEAVGNAYGSFKTAIGYLTAAALNATKPNQNAYEVMLTAMARFFGHDLEWELAKNKDKEAVVQRHVDFTLNFVRQMYGEELHMAAEWVEISEATGWDAKKGYVKASFHIKYNFWHRQVHMYQEEAG